MADISVADVKKLRERTGAGMMDAKKALTEANGDIEAAVGGTQRGDVHAACGQQGNPGPIRSQARPACAAERQDDVAAGL